jgi:hypothetical protein
MQQLLVENKESREEANKERKGSVEDFNPFGMSPEAT